MREMRSRFGGLILRHVKQDISGSFRSLAIADLEQDILTYRKNLVLLGGENSDTLPRGRLL